MRHTHTHTRTDIYIYTSFLIHIKKRFTGVTMLIRSVSALLLVRFQIISGLTETLTLRRLGFFKVVSLSVCFPRELKFYKDLQFFS